MKKLKKIASLLLAAIMVLTMTIPVLATDAQPTDVNTPKGTGSFSISINDETDGYVYEAYQIFKGDLFEEANGNKTLSNIEWGDGVDLKKVATVFGDKSAEDVAKELQNGATSNGDDTDAAKAFAQKIADCLSETAISLARVEGTGYKAEGLTAGYYFVRNKSVPTDGDYTRYMLKVVADVTAEPKRGTLEHDKYIKVTPPEGVEGEDYFKVNNAPIGGTVDYVIPVKLPENYEDYDNYYLGFVDRLSKGLTIDKGSIKLVTVDTTVTAGKEVGSKAHVKAVMDAIEAEPSKSNVVTENFKVQCSPEPEEDVHAETTISIWNHNIKNALKNLKNDTWFILTYSAKVNTDAVIGIDGNPNYVKVNYSNDPNNTQEGADEPDGPGKDHPSGVTPEKDVKTCLTEFAILKTNEKGEILKDAQFSLTGKNNEKITLVNEETFVEDSEGSYWLLKNGQYTMISPETQGIDTDDYAINEDGTYKRYRLETRTFVKTEVGKEGTVQATVGEDGRIIFTGLGVGEYTLKEEVTPNGYNTFEEITFKITFTNKDDLNSEDGFGLEGGTTSDGKQVITLGLGENNTLQADIVNKSGSLLPSTGGIGTTIFYVVGGILVVGAGVLLITKRRMRER